MILRNVTACFYRLCCIGLLSLTVQAAPIPDHAVFWVRYDDSLSGGGDRVMAENISSRISALGYRSIYFPASNPPSPSHSPAPDAIIHVPDQLCSTKLPAVPFRYIILRENGYQLSAQMPVLGMRRMPESQASGATAASSSNAEGGSVASVRESEQSKSGRSQDSVFNTVRSAELDYEGLLLDSDLMRRYQADPSKSVQSRLEAYRALSSSMRRHLDPLLGLSDQSSSSEIAEALERNQLYFGYSQWIFSQQYFTHFVEKISKMQTGRAVVILTGGNLNRKLDPGARNLVSSVRNPSFESKFASASAASVSACADEREMNSSNEYGASSVRCSASGAGGLSQASSAATDGRGDGSVQSKVDSRARALFSSYFKLANLERFQTSDPTLLLMPDKIAHGDFKLLLYLSSLALVTGDRSAEEALSAGVPFVYESLRHKEEFGNQLINSAPPGIISILKREGAYDDEKLMAYASVLRWRGFGDEQVLDVEAVKMLLAQTLIKQGRHPKYVGFFRNIHATQDFNGEALRRFLERIFDQRPILPKFPERGNIFGSSYRMTSSEVYSLELNFDGKCVSRENIERYGLSPDHHFKLERWETGEYVVTLDKP